MSLLVDPNQSEIKIWEDSVESRLMYAIKLCKEYLQNQTDEQIEQTKNHLILTLTCLETTKHEE